MYKRVLLKLSGEALKGNESKQIYDVNEVDQLANAIKALHDQGIQICVVIGAGNIWRGKLANEIGIEPVQADFMGMMGTVINAVALASNLQKKGVDSIVYSAISPLKDITYAYDVEAANKSLNEGKVCFLSGGTGKPFFTTDTASTMRAIELNCEAILMGKNGVEGVFDKDPQKYSDAKFIKTITYDEMLKKSLQIMDLTAVELIKDKNIDIRVFSMSEPENFVKVALGEDIGTTCKRGK